MVVLVVIFLILIWVSIIKSLYRFIKVTKSLKNSKKHINVAPCNYKKIPKIEILIPVFEETGLIEESILYFDTLSEYVNTTYISTSREENHETFDLAVKAIQKHNTTSIKIINCPNKVGNIATQLNYGVKELMGDPIVGIYNVDSKPTVDCFVYVLNNVTKNQVLQQVSYFDEQDKGILKSAQMWQNRWSYIYEMGKYQNKNKLFNFKYTIGHGFFGRLSTINSVGGWDDDQINEDNIMGYKLLLKNIDIGGIPYMEQALFAKNLRIYIKQQSVWFNGPLYAFKYYLKYSTKESLYKKIREMILACVNFKAALSWIFLPILCVLMMIISIISSNYYGLIIIMASIAIYITGLNLLVANEMSKMGFSIKKNLKQQIIYDYIFFLCHCVGPCLTVLNIIKGKNIIQNKYKTEK